MCEAHITILGMPNFVKKRRPLSGYLIKIFNCHYAFDETAADKSSTDLIQDVAPNYSYCWNLKSHDEPS